MTEKTESKLEVWFRPDWHPNLNSILGEIKSEYGYVTDQGTIRLLGPYNQDPDISRFASESQIEGPTISLTANAGLGVLT